MILDNSFRVFSNKFRLVWRVLLYCLLVVVLLSGIALASCYSLIVALSENGFLNQVGDFINANLFNFRIDQILQDGALLFNEFLAIISLNTHLIPFVIILLVVVFLLGSILFGLLELPLIECIYGYMGSCSKLNFMGYFISNFSRSLKYRLSKLIVTVPLDLLIVASFFALLQLFTLSGFLSIIAPFIILLALVLLISLRLSLFAEWGPCIVVNNIGIWKGLKENFKNIRKNYKVVFGTVLITVILAFAANYGLSALTCGVALFISIPATIVFFNVMYTVIYFHLNGLRYYIDKERIITPKKLEDQERIKDMRNLI